MLKAVIFDFDGTLADTLPISFQAFQSVFKKFDNIEITTDEVKAMFGPSETGIIKKNLKNNKHDQAIEYFYEIYMREHQNLVPKNERINQLLLFLKGKGYQLGIVTGKASRSLYISLEKLQMNNLFDIIITGDDVSEPKPHPEGVNRALKQLNIQNTDAIFLGDSDADIMAGKDANVFTIGVQWLPHYQTSEFSVQPDELYHSIDEFIQSL